MLTIDSVKLEREIYSRKTFQDRWKEIRELSLDLINHRLCNGIPDKWYKDIFLAHREAFKGREYIKNAFDANSVSNGMLGEVFFMEACRSLNIYCVPTCGLEDEWGADFKISDGVDTRFLDVTINLSNENLRKKNRSGTFPTVFVPWYLGKDRSQSYATRYIETGEFDYETFINNILSYNYHNLHILRKNVWNDSPKGEGYMALDGVKYLENLGGSLDILKGRESATVQCFQTSLDQR